MRKSMACMLSLAACLAAGQAAFGVGSTVVFTPVTLTNAALAADGWIGVKIQLVGVGGATISGWDFKNQPHLHPLQGPVGISGTIEQKWTAQFDPDTGDPLPPAATPYGTFPTSTASGQTDSFFGFPQTLMLANPDPAFEDNNLANGTNPPFTRSPIGDTSFADFGVGTTMTISGDIANINQPSTLNLAFVIVPIGSTIHFAGQVVDYTAATDVAGSTFYAMDVTIVPEPGSLSVMGVAAMGWVIRRRRRVAT